MTTPSKIANLNPKGYALVTQAGTKIKQAEIVVDGNRNADKVELAAGLANRRKLYIKLLGDDDSSSFPQPFIYIGNENIDVLDPTDPGDAVENNAMPVWVRSDLLLDVGPVNRVYALLSDDSVSQLKVRILEIA